MKCSPPRAIFFDALPTLFLVPHFVFCGCYFLSGWYTSEGPSEFWRVLPQNRKESAGAKLAIPVIALLGMVHRKAVTAV